MGTVYARGQKLWVGFKAADGKMTYRATSYRVGQEAKARSVVDGIEKQIAEGEVPVLDPSAMTVAEYADRWHRERRARGQFSADNDESRLRVHVLPVLGTVKLEELQPKQVRDFVHELNAKIGRGKKQLAPRTVRQIHGTLRAMLNDAVADELMDSNPALLKRDVLPKKADKDPLWRSGAVFSHDEVLLLISSPVVPEDRRTLNALMALTGMRFGEVAALRWSDYERKFRPLGKLSVYKSFNVEKHVEKGVKTEQPREVPVHPTLALLLEAWWKDGWKRMMGRDPAADDLIIPSREGRNRNVNKGLTRFHQDLDRLELRKRRQHDLRRTFISLAISDGARGDIIRWSTHGPRGDIMDMYTTLSWESRCAEAAKLRITMPQKRPLPAPQQKTPEAVIPSGTAVSIALSEPPSAATDLLQFLLQSVATGASQAQKSPESWGLGAGVLQRGGRDLNPRPPA